LKVTTDCSNGAAEQAAAPVVLRHAENVTTRVVVLVGLNTVEHHTEMDAPLTPVSVDGDELPQQ
jgi:hypothetical protein